MHRPTLVYVGWSWFVLFYTALHWAQYSIYNRWMSKLMQMWSGVLYKYQGAKIKLQYIIIHLWYDKSFEAWSPLDQVTVDPEQRGRINLSLGSRKKYGVASARVGPQRLMPDLWGPMFLHNICYNISIAFEMQNSADMKVLRSSLGTLPTTHAMQLLSLLSQ